MSKNLFIRIKAETYSDEEVQKSWPQLFALVWPDELPNASRGVLQLAQSVTEIIRFSLVSPDESSSAISKDIEALLYSLEKHLADQNVAEAKKVAGAIELALDKLEATFYLKK